jgi:hypothetical protein
MDDPSPLKISISKATEWNLERFAKVPPELLICDALTPTTKLLWILLANQANFRPISKSVLEHRLGIARSTRIRALAELREHGFVTGTDQHLVLHDPLPILDKIAQRDECSRLAARIDLGIEEIAPAKPKREKPEKQDYFEAATEAWNEHRPANYGGVRRMSAELLKAVDNHIAALRIQPHDYEHFFSVLAAGVERSAFWSKENSNKSLQSIVGIGSPTSKKFQNVYTLYNDGLDAPQDRPKVKRPRDTVVIPARAQALIQDYDELHYLYSDAIMNSPERLPDLGKRIEHVEAQFKELGLEPADFRMAYGIPSWPTNTPEPSSPRKVFWRYAAE